MSDFLTKFILEPSLLVPDKKPTGEVEIDTDALGGIRLNQYLRGRGLVSGRQGTLDNAAYSSDGLIITEHATNLYGLDFNNLFNGGSISGPPFGIFYKYKVLNTYSSGYWGGVGLYGGTGEANRVYYGSYAYKNRPGYCRGKQAFSPQLAFSGGVINPTIGDIFTVLAVTYAADSHEVFILKPDGSILSDTDATDISAWGDYDFDSFSLGTTYEYDAASLGDPPAIKVYTGGFFHGAGVNKTFCKGLLRNPYKYLKSKSAYFPFGVAAAAGGNSPTGTIYGPLGGPLCGPI